MFRSSRSVFVQGILAFIVVALATTVLWRADLLASGASGDTTVVKVARGESLRSIAAKYGMPREELAANNDLAPNAILFRGQRLIVPVIATAEAVAQENTAAPTALRTHIVQRGESLRSIAHTYNTSAEVLAEINGLRVNQPLFRGARLLIPDTDQPVAAPAPVTEPAAVTPEPTAEPVAEPTAEPTEEPAEEPVAEPTAEPTEEPAEEAVAEATPVPTEEPAAEPTAEPTEEPAEEAAVEATPVPTEEPAEEPAAEATPAPTEEATPAPTAEPTEEPVIEPTAEPTEEPTEEAEAPALVDIVDTAVAAGNLNILVASLQAAGLADALKGEGPFTVFAPTDEAFTALPMGALDALLLDPEGDLAQILLYHVVAGTILAADLSDGLTVTTLQGGELIFTLSADGAQVNDAAIVVADIETTNGVIHVIDAVLLPAP